MPMVSKSREEVIERFWDRVIKMECWEWLHNRGSHGYGEFYTVLFGGSVILAHRLSWILKHGDIPKGLQIDHKCRNRGCVNPDHLRLVTIAQNVTENSGSVAAANKAKQTCRFGHYAYRLEKCTAGVRRVCVACKKTTARRHYLKTSQRVHRAA